MMKPRMRPAMGEVSMGTITFHSKPLPSQKCCLLGCDQIMTFQLPLEAARAEPQRPPMSAWLELDGRPNHQVSRFQMIAPSRAQMMMSELITTSFESTSPDEMVLATAVPHMAPSRLVTAASRTAWRGVSTLVETTVAIELAVSWKPLMYSKMSATAMTVNSKPMLVDAVKWRGYQYQGHSDSQNSKLQTPNSREIPNSKIQKDGPPQGGIACYALS